MVAVIVFIVYMERAQRQLILTYQNDNRVHGCLMRQLKIAAENQYG